MGVLAVPTDNIVTAKCVLCARKMLASLTHGKSPQMPATVVLRVVISHYHNSLEAGAWSGAQR